MSPWMQMAMQQNGDAVPEGMGSGIPHADLMAMAYPPQPAQESPVNVYSSQEAVKAPSMFDSPQPLPGQSMRFNGHWERNPNGQLQFKKDKVWYE